MLLLFRPPITIIRSTGCSASSAITASCRSCVALQIVSNARKRDGQLGVAVAVAHRRAEHLADLQRLRAEHRRLVGAADALRDRGSGSNPGDGGVLEARQERRRVAAGPDVVAHGVGFVAIEDDEILPAAGVQRLRRRGPRLLVPVLAVNDRGEAVLGVALHVLPDVQHRAAGGVDQRAAAPLEIASSSSIVTPNAGRITTSSGVSASSDSPSIAQEADALRAKLVVDVRVVDDLAGQVDGAVRETGAAPGRRSRRRDRRRSRSRTRARDGW